MSKSPAFTLIETLLVVAILAILTVGVFINFVSSSGNRALITAGEKLADNVRRVQVFSQQNKDAQAWGVRYISQNKYQIISGDPTDASTWTAYKEFILENNINFRQDMLGFKVWFMKNKGEMDTNNTVLTDNKIFLQNQQGRLLELEIKQTGLVQTKVQ